jgi:HK97 family phage prohead protease
MAGRPAQARDFNPDQPRDETGKWTAGIVTDINQSNGSARVLSVHDNEASANAHFDQLEHPSTELHSVEVIAPHNGKVTVVASGAAPEKGQWSEIHGVFNDRADAVTVAESLSKHAWDSLGLRFEDQFELDKYGGDHKIGDLIPWPGLRTANDYFDEPHKKFTVATREVKTAKKNASTMNRAHSLKRREIPGQQVRAHSLLQIKAVEEGDQRVISGMATTPTPDRMGDVVQSLGITFKNPLPLLHQHQHDKPVGMVKFSKPTKDGIEFTASMPRNLDPGPLKDRVDTAWGEVKAGLVRGVSIGFIPTKYAFMDDGGIEFQESEVIELSLVTIPANADATIAMIKSIDGALRGVEDEPRDDQGRWTSGGGSQLHSAVSRARLDSLSQRVQDAHDSFRGAVGELRDAEKQLANAQKHGEDDNYLGPTVQESKDNVDFFESEVHDAAKRLNDAMDKLAKSSTSISTMINHHVSTRSGNRKSIDAAHRRAASDWRVGAGRDLPVSDESGWDGPAAEASIFDHAGFDGDSPNTGFARRGFLVYDAGAPALRGSYKLPIARVINGTLTVTAGGVRAAASRLPQTDIPDTVRADAQGVVDHYEAKLKIGSGDGKSARAVSIRGNVDDEPRDDHGRWTSGGGGAAPDHPDFLHGHEGNDIVEQTEGHIDDLRSSIDDVEKANSALQDKSHEATQHSEAEPDSDSPDFHDWEDQNNENLNAVADHAMELRQALADHLRATQDAIGSLDNTIASHASDNGVRGKSVRGPKLRRANRARKTTAKPAHVVSIRGNVDDEPRDDHGKWTSGGGSGGLADHVSALMGALNDEAKFQKAFDAIKELKPADVKAIAEAYVHSPPGMLKTKDLALQQIDRAWLRRSRFENKIKAATTPFEDWMNDYADCMGMIVDKTTAKPAHAGSDRVVKLAGTAPRKPIVIKVNRP